MGQCGNEGHVRRPLKSHWSCFSATWLENVGCEIPFLDPGEETACPGVWEREDGFAVVVEGGEIGEGVHLEGSAQGWNGSQILDLLIVGQAVSSCSLMLKSGRNFGSS